MSISSVTFFHLNLFALSGLLIACSSFVMAILVLLKGKQYFHLLWALFCISVMIWGLGVYFIAQTHHSGNALFLWRLTHIGIIFIPILFLHFVQQFLKRSNIALLIFAYVLGILFLIVDLFSRTLFITDVRWVFNQFYYDSTPGPLYILFTAIFFILVGYAHILLLREFRIAKNNRRQQIKYFFLGFAVSFAGGSLSFLPVYGINFYPFFNLTAFLYTIIVGYAIMHHRLFGIRILITRSMVFGIVMFACYFTISLTVFVIRGVHVDEAPYQIILASTFAFLLLYGQCIQARLSRFVQHHIPVEGIDFTKEEHIPDTVNTIQNFWMLATDIAQEYSKKEEIQETILYVLINSTNRWTPFHKEWHKRLLSDHVIPYALSQAKRILFRGSLDAINAEERYDLSSQELKDLMHVMDRLKVDILLPLWWQGRELRGFVMIRLKDEHKNPPNAFLWDLVDTIEEMSFCLSAVLNYHYSIGKIEKFVVADEV